MGLICAPSLLAKQQQVVSLDYCADQYTLALIPRDNIAALSIDAQRHFSYMRKEAKGLPQVRPSAENVLAFQPNLIIRSYGGGPNAKKFYENLDIPVVQIGFTQSIEQVEAEIIRIANALDRQAVGNKLVSNMRTRLAALKNLNSKKEILYVTPGGITSGTGTLVNELITSAGLNNFEQKPGWHSLPLETLTLRQPELVATAFYQNDTNHQNFWSAARHPIIRDQLANTPAINLEGATTACGGWFLVDAVEKLAEGAYQ